MKRMKEDEINPAKKNEARVSWRSEARVRRIGERYSSRCRSPRYIFGSPDFEEKREKQRRSCYIRESAPRDHSHTMENPTAEINGGDVE